MDTEIIRKNSRIIIAPDGLVLLHLAGAAPGSERKFIGRIRAGGLELSASARWINYGPQTLRSIADAVESYSGGDGHGRA